MKVETRAKRMNNLPQTLDKDDIAAIVHSLDYARWDHPSVMKCFNMMRQLNNWLDTCYAPEFRPHASVNATAFGVVLMVGEVCVWDSENDGEEEINLDFCKSKLKEHALNAMVPFE